MDNENQIIEEDKKKNPNCSYSDAYQKSCSLNNEDGKFLCETIRNIERVCPNKKPIVIYSKKTVTNSNSDEMGKDIISTPLIPSIERFLNQKDPFDSYSDPLFKAESFFESLFGLNNDKSSSDDYRNKPRQQHDHFERFTNNEKKPSGRIAGSVEDI